MSKISLEVKEVLGTDYFWHLYLVYENNAGDEYVIRGGPASLPAGDPLVTQWQDGSGNYLLLSNTNDARGAETASDRGAVQLNLGSRSAQDVWEVMVQHAEDIHDAQLDYEVNYFSGASQNSNSVIA